MFVSKAWVATMAAATAIGIAACNAPEASAQPQEDDPGVSSQSDGTSSGAIQEDDTRWSCVDAGNHVCGPLSDDYGHTPGCYDDGGVLVAVWPCEAWKPSDGYRHGDGTVTYASGPFAWEEGSYVGGYN